MPDDSDDEKTPVEIPQPRTRTRDRETVIVTADDVGEASAVLKPPTKFDDRTTTTDGQPPAPGFETASAPQPVGEDGQHGAYWVLSEAERAKGFVRPVRRSYHHTRCGTVTTMGLAIAETYAREPGYYGSTFCVHCKEHLRVGADGEFVWCNSSGAATTEKVGT